ncbi:hypothetical protein GIB67_033124 [Kingdonia uniflora]|uniref:Trehalose-phosphatase n=1 Tax=Kingdonia uniflora TaxID=39325 RepID=A0A7J7MZ23_9MAGN|nr:hypothetical protein GIB67_033124 [Kingdonia uniflora]
MVWKVLTKKGVHTSIIRALTSTTLGNGLHSISSSVRSIAGIAGQPLRSYLDYIGHLYQRMDPLPEQERFELSYRDFLQSPSQILNKEAIEASEKERPVPEIRMGDIVQIKLGISKGLIVENLILAMVCNEKPSDIVMCIGDDRSDEDMFEKVLSIINNPLLPAVLEIFACTVGQKPSKEKYYLDDIFEVVSLLQSLSKQHDI